MFRQMNEIDKLNRRAKYFQPLINKAVEVSGLQGCILDVGCGPGSSTNLLKQALPDSSITGIDNNSSYIKFAKEKYPFSDFVCANCYEIPLNNSMVDSCFALNLLEVLTNPICALNEMYRVTKPGGIICIVDIDYRNIIVEPMITHLKKLQRVNCLIKKRCGYDPFVGDKLFGYFKETKIPVTFSGKIRIDNIISDGFENTLLNDDMDKMFLIENRIFSESEINEMFDMFREVKNQPNFLFAIDYNIVCGTVSR